MATLYQLCSTMDTLKSCTKEMSLTWRVNDSILLLGSTVAFIDWLDAYLDDVDIDGIKAIYALQQDVDQLGDIVVKKIKANTKLNAILTDDEWVALTHNLYADSFDKIVTIAR